MALSGWVAGSDESLLVVMVGGSLGSFGSGVARPADGLLSLAGWVPEAFLGSVGDGVGRGRSRCPAASGADSFAARSPGCWVVGAGSVTRVRAGRSPGGNPPRV